MSNKKPIKTIAIFHRDDNSRAAVWAKKIETWIKKRRGLKVVNKKPDALIALGGDGAILEAARRYQKENPVILGLNLGRVGFLASVREPRKFLAGVRALLEGRYHISERLMLEATIIRKGKAISKVNSLNDISVQDLLGIANIEVMIDRHPIQYIYGSGVLVSTPTGSTAYNLSAHGPIVMPGIKCLIVSELLDHNIPTPSIVVESSVEIRLSLLHFRKHGLLTLTDTGKPVDVVLSSDGGNLTPLAEGDVIAIRRSPRLVRFAETEKNYFLKSLQEKFAFK